MTKIIRSTPKQRKDLQTIKEQSATNGYLIFDLLKRIRRNPHDFLLVHKKVASTIMVRIGDKHIELCPYQSGAIHNYFIDELQPRCETKIVKGALMETVKDNDMRLIITPSERILLKQIAYGIEQHQ